VLFHYGEVEGVTGGHQFGPYFCGARAGLNLFLLYPGFPSSAIIGRPCRG